jgi:hypothetical protein
VLLTPNSQFSPYVQQEIGFAKARNKLVIPIVQNETSHSGLAMLEGIEYIQFDPNDPQGALTSLRSYLERLKKGKDNAQAILMGIGTILFLAFISEK